MTIKDTLKRLETSKHPVANALHKGDHFKVLVIAFKKGMILNDHKAHMPSKLTVIEGSVIYNEGGQFVELKKFDETDIPVEITHSVEAKEDSLCLLTQGALPL
jgi:quercetin dioxygenase-like cupin family protein